MDVRLPTSPVCTGEVFFFLLLNEGQTVGALVHGGIALMGTDLDFVQRAVILHGTMVYTLIDRTFNGLVCLIVHHNPPLTDVQI